MYYNFGAENLPHISKIYSATRNTGWIMSESQNLLIYILDGTCSFEIDGKRHDVKKDSLIFIPADQNYIRRPDGDKNCSFLYIHFTMDSKITIMNRTEAQKFLIDFKRHIDNALLTQDANPNDKQFLIYNMIDFESSSQSIKACVDNIINHNKNQYIESPLMISLSLCQILSIMTTCTIKSLISSNEIARQESIPSEIKALIFYINNHYDSHISIKDLCDYSCLSKQQLIRAFKKHLHTTPTAYIIDSKLYYAKSLLSAESNLSISEISNELGFSDQHYFCRIFKKKSGMTPGDYRRSTSNITI